MRTKSYLQVLFVLLVFVGCSASYNASLEVNNGMNKDEVLDIMGTPGNRQFNGAKEAWQYCDSKFAVDEYIVVWFNRGLVTGITTYRQRSSFDTVYRTINWQEAPDVIIERRNR